MACAGLFVLTMLAAATPGMPDAVRENAQPPLSTVVPASREALSKPIDLSIARAIHNVAMTRSEEPLSSPEMNRVDEASARPSINIGPLHTEFGGTTGRHMNFATMRLEGISVFGGSVGASIGGRSTRITLTWPTSP